MSSSPAPPEALRLLVVDDDATTRTLLMHRFRQQHYAVATAADGEDALAQLAAQRHDIVITDIQMPRLSGLTLLREISRAYPMARAIAVSGVGPLHTMIDCLDAGAFSFVAKPFGDFETLDEAVATAARVIRLWHSELRRMRGMEGLRS